MSQDSKKPLIFTLFLIAIGLILGNLPMLLAKSDGDFPPAAEIQDPSFNKVTR